MNLKYIEFNDCIDKNKIKKIYLESFFKEERYPFWLLKKSTKNDNVGFYGIYDDERLIGFEYIIKKYDGIFIWYFAIDENEQNKGYGTSIINDLKEKYNNKSLVLAVERQNGKDDDKKIKRKEFYLKNGFFETNIFNEDSNIEYELLCTNTQYKIDSNILKNVYKQMTKAVFMGNIINKIYNIDYVNIID